MLSYVAQQTLNNKNIPTFTIGGTEYKGSNPVFVPTYDESRQFVTGFNKVMKGVPFVKVVQQ